MVKTISESLIKYGKVVRGYLGISIQDITPDMAKSLKLDNNFKGVILADINPDGPAAKAGLEQGDIIFRFNGKNVEGSMQLRNLVAITNPGTSVKVGVLRNGREMEILVRIGDMERFLKQAKAQIGDELLGLTVEKVTPDVARNAGLRRPTGVVVTNVTPNSPAERTGIEPGDIIFQVGNRRILNSSEFNSLVASAAEQGSVMLLLRDGKSGRIGYIVVPLERG
jgi:serine protease Do